jgi:hypothetical protein
MGSQMIKSIIPVLLLIAPLASAQVPPCNITLSGPVQVYAKGYYLHQSEADHHKRYTVSSEPIVAPVGHSVTATLAGLPVAVEWYSMPYGATPFGYQLVGVCGDVPDLTYPGVFDHGFDGGSTMGWDRVVGDG